MSKPIPPSGKRVHVGMRLSPAEADEVRTALEPGEKLAAGMRRLLLEAVRAMSPGQ